MAGGRVGSVCSLPCSMRVRGSQARWPQNSASAGSMLHVTGLGTSCHRNPWRLGVLYKVGSHGLARVQAIKCLGTGESAGVGGGGSSPRYMHSRRQFYENRDAGGLVESGSGDSSALD